MTPNKEDYLKCIYEIGQTEKVTNKVVAAAMNVSAPATSEMIKKLLQDKQIKKDEVIGYIPTVQGMNIISDIIRKHRIIEVFLIQSLNFPTDIVHQEAEILEHAVSDLFIERLETFLDYPTVCPHGGSIPKKGELLEEKYTRPLIQADVGSYTIKRIIDQPELLHYLSQFPLQIGDKITVTHNDAYAQMITLHHHDKTIHLSYIIAKQMYIH